MPNGAFIYFLELSNSHNGYGRYIPPYLEIKAEWYTIKGMAQVPLEQTRPTDKTGIELAMCPICFGHTKLLGGNVYCPNCAVIISENVSDSLKTKVQLIREQVEEKKAEPEKRQAVRRSIVRSVFTGFGGFFLIINFAVIGYVVYFYMQAKGHESAGEYQKAKLAYEQSTLIFPLPGVKEAIAKNKRLAISNQSYRKGVAAANNEMWQEAIAHFEKVENGDRDYALAQIEIEKARMKLMETEKESPGESEPEELLLDE